MAHVRITQGDNPEALKIEVDGVDLSQHILTEGFGLVQVGGIWGVRLTLAPDALDIDLPQALLVTEAS